MPKKKRKQSNNQIKDQSNNQVKNQDNNQVKGRNNAQMRKGILSMFEKPIEKKDPNQKVDKKIGLKFVAFLGVFFLLLGVPIFYKYKTTESVETPEDVALPQFKQTGNEIEAIIETSMGTIEVVLFPDQAPKAVENFVTHAEDGYYDGMTVHRVVDGLMIQTGDPTGEGNGGESIWGTPFEDEFSDQLYHFRGAVCYANSGADTNGSQFYIVQAGTEYLEENGYTEEELIKQGYPENVAEKYMEVGGAPHLDGEYTVFGMVTEGMDVVDEIAGVEAEKDGTPVDPVYVESITIVE